MELPKRLKRLRKVFRYTGKEIAEKIGVSDSTYRNYETGKREPSLSILILISKIYSVSLDYLVGLTDEAPQSSINLLSERYSLNEMEKRILKFYMTLPDRERLQFMSAMKAIENNNRSVYEKHLTEILELEEKKHDMLQKET